MHELLKPFLLDDKIALVTGASSGFGLHFAKVLAQAGARVVLGDLDTEDPAQKDAQKILADYARAEITRIITDQSVPI